jgi:hypothetical protein
MGVQGYTGFQGYTGYGPQGSQGLRGLTGYQGDQGDKGTDGEFGGAIFEFVFDAGTSETDDPTSGKIRFNDQVSWDSTKLMIDISSNKDKNMIMEIAQSNKVILDVFCKSI